MLSKEKYRKYSVQELICDESFQNWIYKADPESDAFWKSLALESPQQEASIRLASDLLKSIAFRVDKPADGRAAASLQQTLERINFNEYFKTRAAEEPTWRRIWKIAAALLLIAGIASVLWWLAGGKAGKEVLSTAFGEIDTARLPDASMIILNGNSRISRAATWKAGAPREVWLSGEAYFDVRHLTPAGASEAQPFKVYVGPLTVEVLGTRFNIRQRRSEIAIALLQGSVRLSSPQQDGPIEMKPGDLIRFDTTTKQLIKATTDTEKISSWTQKKLILTNPTLREICSYLEDIYGKKIILGDPALGAKKVEGPILLDSLEDALFILSTVLNVTIVEEQNTLIIRSK
ncbi:FecR family protein [Niabella insulamsoli]|uniref:FecR family protein n=1 Tax=Niabella insulamsoli TaxID=3144874 RepID=UPI0031FC932D